MDVEQLTTKDGRTIEGPLLIKPKVFGDERGWFFESWNQRRFDATVGEPVVFSQDNHSRSVQGVLRGLHYQLPPEPQAKLVRASQGVIFDVAVDIRQHSPTFGLWVGAELSQANAKSPCAEPELLHTRSSMFYRPCTGQPKIAPPSAVGPSPFWKPK